MSNIVEFVPSKTSQIAFCIVDNIDTYANSWIKETIKNVADFTISNLYAKGYSVFVGYDEDKLLEHVSNKEYTHAVIISPGTEFINGFNFFNALDVAVQQDFFVLGHVLDRGDAYYELHHQCYVINLQRYKNLGNPCIGQQELGAIHTQEEPNRSDDNYHDYYTPKSVNRGWGERTYKHKCHGWNILSIAFEKDLPVVVFDEGIRNNKKHLYPESKKDFEDKVSWLYHRQMYCATEFVHTDNTEWTNGDFNKFKQVVLPASGTLYLNLIDEGKVTFYDYNQKALDYWKQHCPRKENIEYEFILTDIINDTKLLNYVDENAFVNLSNIFCYEGSATVIPLAYRLKKEQSLVSKLKNLNATVNITMSAATGFSELSNPRISDLKKPTWHYNQDWF
jgi:hypothetical protein